MHVVFAVMKKHGKLMSFLRTFFSTRPARNQLKQSGIVKERVFGCDLGEHLLNSGNDGELSEYNLHFLSNPCKYIYINITVDICCFSN